MTYRECIERLELLSNCERTGSNPFKDRNNLPVIKDLLKNMGDPHKSYRTIHIAGTKGKGSVTTFIAAMLSATGYKTGSYVSPHLVSVRERISINNDMITETDFVEMFEIIDKVADTGDNPNGLTFFEVITLIAFLYFKQNNVDCAVIECGLGGRLDATNVVKGDIACITPISYDHTHILGDSLEKIAIEKAAIIKNGAICISSAQEPEVMRVISGRCEEENSILKVVGEDITIGNVRAQPLWSGFDISCGKNVYTNCEIRMPGYFQIENAVLGFSAAKAFLEHVNNSREEAVVRMKEGMEQAFIPGRLEVVGKSPTVVLDGAQNIDSAGKLKYSIEHIFNYDRLILLLGVSKDKDIEGIIKEIAPIADEYVVTGFKGERSLDPHIIRGYLCKKKVAVAGDIREALGIALSHAFAKDMILVTGSLYLVGEIRELLSSRGDK
jgi:dihydrofolate synthase / folylpolyglutamate synthase